MSSLVYEELVAGVQDDLALWIRERRRSGLVVEPDEEVQAALREIADYVNGNFMASRAATPSPYASSQSLSTAWAALWPGAPVTSPPGWVPAPHR